MIESLMTEPEAADFFRLTVRQLRKWRKSGKIPALRIGRTIRYDRGAVSRFLEENYSTSRPA